MLTENQIRDEISRLGELVFDKKTIDVVCIESIKKIRILQSIVEKKLMLTF